MTTLNISLPDALKAFVEEQTALRGFHTPSDYILSLLCEIQNRMDRVELEEKLLTALDEEANEMKPADWESLRERVRRTVAEV